MLANRSFWFLNAVEDKETNTLYFFGNNLKGFFSWNRESSEILIIDDLADRAFENEIYDCGILHNKKIYFPPRNTQEMAIYDILSGELVFQKLYSDDVANIIKFRPFFFGHFAFKGSDGTIFFLYREFPIISSYNSNDNVWNYLMPPSGCENLKLAKGYAFNEGIYYFPALNTNKIMLFDSNTKVIECIEIEVHKEDAFAACIYSDGCLVLLSIDSSRIYRYEIEKGITRMYELQLEQISNSDRRTIQKQNDHFLLLPMVDVDTKGKMTMTYKLDSEMRVVDQVETFKNYRELKKWNILSTDDSEWYVLFNATFEDHADAYWTEGMVMGEVNKDSLDFVEMKFPLPNGWTEEMISERIAFFQSQLNFQAYDLTYESERVGLGQFLQMLLLK